MEDIKQEILNKLKEAIEKCSNKILQRYLLLVKEYTKDYRSDYFVVFSLGVYDSLNYNNPLYNIKKEAILYIFKVYDDIEKGKFYDEEGIYDALFRFEDYNLNVFPY